MPYYQTVDANCHYCKKGISGKLISDFDEVLTAVSQNVGNKTIAIMCPECKSVFCEEHKKQTGWKFMSGYAKANCPNCGANLKNHISVVHMVDEVSVVESTQQMTSSSLPLDELIREMGAKKEFLPILTMIGKKEYSEPKIQEALKDIFKQCDDIGVMETIANNLQNGTSKEELAASLTALTYMDSPQAVHYLMKIYDMNISLHVGGSTYKSISPMIKECIQEIGEKGNIQLLSELEESSGDPSKIDFILGTMFPLLKQKKWDEAVQFLNSTKYLMVFQRIVSILLQAGWEPQAEEEEAIVHIIKRNWRGLKKMRSASESAIIKLLSLEHSNMFPYYKVINILGEVGTLKSIDILRKLSEDRRYKKYAEKVIAKIEES